jgi:cobalt-precorrin-5B (C1)-methyltransferase
MKSHVKKDGKTLRRGYTTGTCAAAAAKGAVALLFGRTEEKVVVDLPRGETVRVSTSDLAIKNEEAICCVIKDAGDDPDVTDKAKICARARQIGDGIILKGGEGVGVVTKPGLQVEVGQPAINPVPREMILEEIQKALPNGKGVEVTVFVPQGEELAKRTMNKKLGIIGGISIIGTTGIVEPKSEEAFKDSLIPQIRIALAQGYGEVVLTPGGMGEKNAISRGIPEDAIIQMSNFVGFMLQECAKRGVKKVLLFGHLSKLTKVAAGFFNTHSRVSDSRIETIASHASLVGINKETIESVLNANTAEHAMEVLRESGDLAVFDSIAKEAARKARQHVNNRMEIGAVLLSLKGEIVGEYNTEVCRWGRYMS